MKNKSFTLIELLVVIVIIGILAGVIIVSVSSSINKANFAKAQSFSNTVQNELLGDLVSEWTFDIASNPGEDTWGNNDGTVYGAATYKTKADGVCVYGGCYEFDGSNGYIEVAPATTLNQNYTGFTASAWVKYTETQPGTDSLGYVVHKNNLSTVAAASYVLLIAGKKARWQVHNGTSSIGFTSDLDYNDGIWHYLIGIYNGQNIILYIDGSNIKSTTITSFVNNDGYLSIGGTRYASTYRPFKGSIDDVRLYNAALSSSQIKQQYVAGLDSLLSNENISKEEYDERLNSLAFEGS